MSHMNWNRLAPHRPLEAGDALRVERPSNNAERLASLIKAGMGPIAVVGPVGSGKSTELAAASKALEASFVTALVPLDRLMDMRQLDEGLMFIHAGHQLAQSAGSFRLSLSRSSGAFDFYRAPEDLHSQTRASRNDLLSFLREVRRSSPQRAVALLLDGLEKCPGDIARQAIRSLLTLREAAELVVVTPLDLVTGPEGYELLTELRAFPVRPVPVFRDTETDWQAGRAFLKEVFRRRMGLSVLDADLERPLTLAAVASNGLPRTFLQILRSAGGYAAIANRELPSDEDVYAAIQDQKESLQRILRDGDLAILARENGSDGLEIPIDRRIRLLAHGLLLEYEERGKIVVRMNRLLQFSGHLVP